VANSALVGRTYEPPPFQVTEANLRAYISAVGDRQEEALAPPTYAIVYGYPPVQMFLNDPEVGVDVAHLVHGEQSFRFHRSVRAGDVLYAQGRFASLQRRADIEMITFDLSARDGAGALVTEASALFVIRT
jgi:hypothetical protein